MYITTEISFIDRFFTCTEIFQSYPVAGDIAYSKLTEHRYTRSLYKKYIKNVNCKTFHHKILRRGLAEKKCEL